MSNDHNTARGIAQSEKKNGPNGQPRPQHETGMPYDVQKTYENEHKRLSEKK